MGSEFQIGDASAIIIPEGCVEALRENEAWATMVIHAANEVAGRIDNRFKREPHFHQINLFITKMVVSFQEVLKLPEYKSLEDFSPSDIRDAIQDLYPANTELITELAELSTEMYTAYFRNPQEKYDTFELLIKKHNIDVCSLLERMNRCYLLWRKREFRSNLIDKTRIAVQAALSSEMTTPKTDDNDFGGQPVRSKIAQSVQNGVILQAINQQARNETLIPRQGEERIEIQHKYETEIRFREKTK